MFPKAFDSLRDLHITQAIAFLRGNFCLPNHTGGIKHDLNHTHPSVGGLGLGLFINLDLEGGTRIEKSIIFSKDAEMRKTDLKIAVPPLLLFISPSLALTVRWKNVLFSDLLQGGRVLGYLSDSYSTGYETYSVT